MSQPNPKFDIATTITNHILDSNMPESVKEYILSKAVFEDNGDGYTLKDKEEEVSNPSLKEGACKKLLLVGSLVRDD